MAQEIAPQKRGLHAAVPTTAPPESLEELHEEHLLYLDNLKIVLIAGVIVAHAATRFVGSGAWLNAQGTVDKAVVVASGVLVLIGTLFWVGLFFLMSGLLVPGSLRHKGAVMFVHDRLIRLGVPLALFTLFVMPVLNYSDYIATSAGHFEDPFTWLAQTARDPDAGPLWFVAALLVMSVAYAVWWAYRPEPRRSRSPLRASTLVSIALAIAASSFAVRLILPLYSRQIFDLHLWQWPQYVIMFWFGAVSAERGWLRALPDRTWRWCGLIALAAAVAVPVLGLVGGGMTGQVDVFEGGRHWQALALDCVEGVLAVTGSLWVLDLFRRYFNRQTAAVHDLARSAYGAFILQAPLVVGIGFVVRRLDLPFEIKFLILAVTGIVASFGLAWLLVVRLRVATRVL